MQSILIVMFLVLLLLGAYVRVMEYAHEKNVEHLTQSLTEIEQEKLKNEVNELMIKIGMDYQYMVEGYNRMLDVIDAAVDQIFSDNVTFDDNVIEKFAYMTTVYKDLEVRIYDQVKEEFIYEIKKGELIESDDIVFDDYTFDFALHRHYTVDNDRYVFTVGIRQSLLETLYKQMLNKQFDENSNLPFVYTLIEVDDYEGGDNFARVIQGSYVVPSCARNGCSISTNYQDDNGKYVVDEMLDSLKRTGTYFGFIRVNNEEHMMYAKMYQEYDLIVLTSTAMEEFYSRTMSDFDLYQQNFQNQIRIAMVIACMSFVTALLGGVVSFNYMKSKEVENERERNRIITEHNKVLSRKNDQINQLAHDIKNHLICIKGFIAHQTPEAASDYIDSVYEDLNQLSTIVITGNHLVDIILNDKISEMRKGGIIFEKQIEKVSLDFIDFKEMTVILTNMLDNAIESCEQSKEKKINFSISSFHESYVIMKVVNSCDVPPIISKGKLKTTKRQKEGHGYGVKNIERAISKYDGEIYFDYDVDGRMFTFAITLRK